MKQELLLGSGSPGVIYDMREDAVLLAQMRRASLSSGRLGLTLEHGVVGSAEWWNAVESGKIKIESFIGTIQRVEGGPMGDSAIIRIEGDGETRSWTAWEGFVPGLVGKRVDVRYANVPPKHPPTPGFVVDLLIQVRLID